jgi:hypothetical protein
MEAERRIGFVALEEHGSAKKNPSNSLEKPKNTKKRSCRNPSSIAFGANATS